jgi:hypothetical protein
MRSFERSIWGDMLSLKLDASCLASFNGIGPLNNSCSTQIIYHLWHGPSLHEIKNAKIGFIDEAKI